MSFSEKHDKSPLAAEGGVAARPASERDAYDMLDDLMVVVEALCPVWPNRTPSITEADFRL